MDATAMCQVKLKEECAVENASWWRQCVREKHGQEAQRGWR